MGLMVEMCRRCGASIVWCDTESGKHMPVDAERLKYGGNVRLQNQGEGNPPLAKVVRAGQGGYRAHFATCKAKGLPANQRRKKSDIPELLR